MIDLDALLQAYRRTRPSPGVWCFGEAEPLIEAVPELVARLKRAEETAARCVKSTDEIYEALWPDGSAHDQDTLPAVERVGEMHAEIAKLRSALRKRGPCAAVREPQADGDRIECQRRHGHPGDHSEMMDNGFPIYCWPDSDVDPVATQARERQIRGELVEGGW